MGRINLAGGGVINPPLDTTVNQVLEGRQFSINGKDILVGTMVNRGVLGVTPSDTEQNFLAGYYPSITIAARPALSGNATVGEVLGGKTFYNSTYTRQNGTMVDRGALSITPNDSVQTGAAGYYSGITIAARPALSGNAVVGDVLANKTFYSSTYTKQTGSMPNKNGIWSTPNIVAPYSGGIYVVPPAGYFSGDLNYNSNGGLNIVDADFVAGNFLATKNIFGLQGSIPVRTGTDTEGTYPIAVNSSFGPGMAYLMPPAGYYDGTVWVRNSQPNLQAANIKEGVVIGSITGTMKSGANIIAGSNVTLREIESRYVDGYLNSFPDWRNISSGIVGQFKFKGQIRISYRLYVIDDSKTVYTRAYSTNREVVLGPERASSSKNGITFNDDIYVEPGDYIILQIKTTPQTTFGIVDFYVKIEGTELFTIEW